MPEKEPVFAGVGFVKSALISASLKTPHYLQLIICGIHFLMGHRRLCANSNRNEWPRERALVLEKTSGGTPDGWGGTDTVVFGDGITPDDLMVRSFEYQHMEIAMFEEVIGF